MTHYHGPAPAQVWRELGPCCSAALNLAPLPVQVSSVLVCLVNKQQLRLVRCVDLYPSIVLLAWSLARSDEIDLSAIAVKREILQFVIAYCSLDL